MKKKILAPEEGYNLYSKQYYKDYNLLDSFDWGKTKKILNKYIKSDKELILDLGCGDGRIIKRLKKKNIIGLDISIEMIKIAKNKSKENIFIIGDALHIPFIENTFDIIYSFFLLVHISNLNLLFKEVYNTLKKSGIFISNNIPQKKPPILNAGKEKFIIKSYNYTDIEVITAAENNGFELIEIQEEIQKNTKVSSILVFRKNY